MYTLFTKISSSLSLYFLSPIQIFKQKKNKHHFSCLCPFSLTNNSMYYHDHSFPCLHCHPHSYIRMVQHLIERCLLLKMTRDKCIKTLEQHARIKPAVTLTVWRELLRENKDFFQAYFPKPRFGRRRHWRC